MGIAVFGKRVAVEVVAEALTSQLENFLAPAVPPLEQHPGDERLALHLQIPFVPIPRTLVLDESQQCVEVRRSRGRGLGQKPRELAGSEEQPRPRHHPLDGQRAGVPLAEQPQM